nr:MAG TPA: hypothetical protein [Caudoviricetes sp.]
MTHRLSGAFTQIVQREKIIRKTHSTNNNKTRIYTQIYKC